MATRPLDKGEEPGPSDLPQLGCDVARFGDDRTEITARRGMYAVTHEDHGGWDTVRIADRLMRLADELAAVVTAGQDKAVSPLDPKAVPIKVDDTGVGGGVTDILRANGFRAVAVNAGESDESDKYPRVRDRLWFDLRDRAKAGTVRLGGLGAKRCAQLEVQALAPTWTPTPDRKRRVEPKEDTKKRLGRSPDGMDAVNLAYYEPGDVGGAEWVDTERCRSWRDRTDSRR